MKGPFSSSFRSTASGSKSLAAAVCFNFDLAFSSFMRLVGEWGVVVDGLSLVEGGICGVTYRMYK